MVLYRCFQMYAQGDSLTPDTVDEINSWLEARGIIGWALQPGTYGGDKYDIESGEICENYAVWDTEECVWWENDNGNGYMVDMTDLSRAFPTITFNLYCDGTERDDIWDCYWLNGEHEMCCASPETPEPVKIKWE